MENDVKTDKKEEMKAKTTGLLISLLALASLPASATSYSGADFSTMAEANGTYVAGSPGYEALSYASPDVDAVVGVRGPLGDLDTLSMSFVYSDVTGGPGNAPFAAFGLSLDGTWGLGHQEFDIISEDGNQLYGYSDVHVWDFTTDADVPGLTDVTLDSILNLANPYSSATYGDLEAMRAYAYVGDEGALSGSADINSITIGSFVTSVPDVTSTMSLLGIGFGALVGLRRRLNRS